ncbi:MAG: DNA-processing protein DprA [Candidatus Babeliales bacterium]|jgi:DNA processing protein
MNGNHSLLTHLSLITDVGPATIFKLFKHLYRIKFPEASQVELVDLRTHQCELDASVLYCYTALDFIQKVGFSERLALRIVEGLNNKKLLDDERELARRHEVAIVTFLDESYPELLHHIHLPPVVLYCQGSSLQREAKSIGFVGSRRATDYATRAMRKLIPGLVASGWQIVSGGAEGADTIAHELTLECGGRTIAVLGSGLLQPYPASNKKLFEKMIASGSTLVSPFSLMTPPDRGTFPARNRIISGLSSGCVIVQAAERSGALITAQCALEQGRSVFAIPGSITDDLSAGCHRLIQDGAKLVNKLDDILEEFGEGAEVGAQLLVRHSEQSAQIIEVAATKVSSDPVIACLMQPATLDELLDKTGCSADELQDRLFQLQLEGKIRQNFAGTWECVEK